MRPSRPDNTASNDAEIDRLRAEYRASRAGQYLRRVVDGFPPLTAAQIDELQTILAGSHREQPPHSAGHGRPPAPR